MIEGRKNEKWRSDYMKEQVIFMELREEGREEKRDAMIINMINDGELSEEKIAEYAECSVDHVKELIKKRFMESNG